MKNASKIAAASRRPNTALSACCRTNIPANSPSLVRSLRHFRLARISVRGDRNLRHLSIGFFLFFRFPAIISYFPVIIPISVVGKKQGWRLDEVGRHVQETQMQKKEEIVQGPLFNPDWVKEWPALIASSNKGDTYAFCRLCRCDVSVSSGESKTRFEPSRNELVKAKSATMEYNRLHLHPA